jgi:hypothetical protein
LLLSLIRSAINELMERSLENRATDLEKRLRELLDDEKGSGLVKQVYDHGMINGFFKGTYDPTASDKIELAVVHSVAKLCFSDARDSGSGQSRAGIQS